MGIETGYRDHTGRMICDGDRCSQDSGHSHCDDLIGRVGYVKDGEFWFAEDHLPLHLGCPLSEVHSDLEVIVVAKACDRLLEGE